MDKSILDAVAVVLKDEREAMLQRLAEIEAAIPDFSEEVAALEAMIAANKTEPFNPEGIEAQLAALQEALEQKEDAEAIVAPVDY